VKTKRNLSIVVARDPKVVTEGLDIDGKHIDFHGRSAKAIVDPGVVAAIEQKHGLTGNGRVWTHQDERAESAINFHPPQDRGVHHYFFGPTRRYREAWEEIFGDKK
jgi:hypothetical protein